MADSCGIYGIFAVDSDECLYIGESTRIRERWSDHLRGLATGSHVRKDFTEWFKDRGSETDALDFRILEICQPEDLGARERFYFDLFKPRFFGQIPHANRQWFQTEETRKRISDSMKARFRAPGAKSAWQATVDVHGLDRAIELTSGHFKGDSAHGALGGSGNRGKEKAESHRMKIASKLNPLVSNLTRDSLKSSILEGPTNLTALSNRFKVSRPTMRKYIERFELTELLAENLLTPYSLTICPQCKREVTANWLKRHLKTCSEAV